MDGLAVCGPYSHQEAAAPRDRPRVSDLPHLQELFAGSEARAVRHGDVSDELGGITRNRPRFGDAASNHFRCRFACTAVRPRKLVVVGKQLVCDQPPVARLMAGEEAVALDGWRAE